MLWVRVEWKEAEVLTGQDPGVQDFQQRFLLAHPEKKVSVDFAKELSALVLQARWVHIPFCFSFK